MNHYIEFDGVKSSDIGLVLEDVEYGELNARTAFLTIPYRQGGLNASAATGELWYDRRSVTYTFVRSATDTQTLSMQLSADRALFSSKLRGAEVYDSVQNATFSDVQLTGFGKVKYFGIAKNKARLIVTVSAEPFMKSATGGENVL